MRKLEQEENIRKFDHSLRCYNDVLRRGVRPNYPDEVSRYEQARRERLNRIIDLLLLDSKFLSGHLSLRMSIAAYMLTKAILIRRRLLTLWMILRNFI